MRGLSNSLLSNLKVTAFGGMGCYRLALRSRALETMVGKREAASGRGRQLGCLQTTDPKGGGEPAAKT